MNPLLMFLMGGALGAYFAELVRQAVPILDPANKEQ